MGCFNVSEEDQKWAVNVSEQDQKWVVNVSEQDQKNVFKLRTRTVQRRLV